MSTACKAGESGESKADPCSVLTEDGEGAVQGSRVTRARGAWLPPHQPVAARPVSLEDTGYVLTPGTQDCDFTWKSGACRRNPVKMTWYWRRVGPDPCPASSQGGGDTDMHAGRSPQDGRGQDWRDVTIATGHQGRWRSARGHGGLAWPPPQKLPCSHLDSGLPAPRTVRESVSVVFSCPACGPLSGAPQDTHMAAALTSSAQGAHGPAGVAGQCSRDQS